MRFQLPTLILSSALSLSISTSGSADELPERFPTDVPIAEYMEVTNVILKDFYQTELGRRFGVGDTLVVQLSAADESIDEIVTWFKTTLTDAGWLLSEENAQRYVANLVFWKDERVSMVHVAYADSGDDHPGHEECHDHEPPPAKRIDLELSSAEEFMRRGVPREST